MKASTLTKETVVTLGITEKNYPNFAPGDTINVLFKIIDIDKKQRTQNFNGVVIGIRGSGAGKTFRVRKISHGVGIEKIFPYYSPIISEISILRRGKVRRAKLFYLRSRRGKAAETKAANKH